jgi:uncharacterized membrane protein YeaQ/YmgE (transglycosylase-associated protein family)
MLELLLRPSGLFGILVGGFVGAVLGGLAMNIVRNRTSTQPLFKVVWGAIVVLLLIKVLAALGLMTVLLLEPNWRVEALLSQSTVLAAVIGCGALMAGALIMVVRGIWLEIRCRL